MRNPNDLQRITAKELSVKMNISKCAAQNLLFDIRQDYDIKIVTISHIRHYLKIPVIQSTN